MNTEPQIVCVLGMHRSGTSILARLVHILGVDLGSEAVSAPGAPDNPSGFWEHPAFVAVNEALLARAGRRWDDARPIPAEWFAGRDLDDLRAEARAVIARFDGTPRWGWKDPRTAVLLPFWQALLPRLQYVVSVRETADVAQSLQTRNGLDPAQAGRLWLGHMACILEYTADAPRLFVFYDDLMQDPSSELRRLAGFLGAPLSPAIEREALDAIDETLCHWRTTPAAGLDDPTLPFAPRALAAFVRATWRGHADAPAAAAAAVRALARAAVQDEAERGRLTEALRDVARERRADEDRLRQQERRISELEEHLRAEHERVEHLAGQHAEIEHDRHRLLAANEALHGQLETILQSRGWRWLMRYRRGIERYGRLKARLPGRRQTTAAAASSAVVAEGWESIPVLPAVDTDRAARVLSEMPPPRRRHDVICLSIIDWEFRYQRPQQVMAQFAAHGHRVFYVSPSRFVRPEPGRTPAVRSLGENLFEVQLAAGRAPNLYGEVVGGATARTLLESLASLRRTYAIANAVIYVMIPSWGALAVEARSEWGSPVLYDCMDEWENFQGIKPAVAAYERTLAEACDVLVVTAARLYDKWKAVKPSLVLARNAVDVEFYSSRCLPNGRLASVPHPIVGYFGAIADWFDVDLMTRLARERPQYQFVLLGGVFGVDVRALEALPNVSLLGQQPYAAMPEYLHHFDVCLIPFKINPITQATDPVKLYEYLAAGKPVVSVALPELEPCREHVYLAASADDFLAQVDAAVAERDPARAERRRQFAAGNTWAARYETIHDAVVRAVPSASIIIVTHENLALTRLCLESVLRNTPYPACEVLVVDNASTDGTPEFLQALAADHPDVRVILNAQNLGFARANNQALAASRGDHLVLLNNDTVVPPGWLTRLLAHLADPDVGLVGPVTNFVGNEARIEVTYTNIGEMELFAADRGRRHARKIADIPMLAMFCTAMRRDTFVRIGPLDERFGIGMFEDDDYTRRVRAAGLRVVCAADVFVHHVGQAAFKKLIAGGQYDALFEANRRSYEAKWGTWTAHRHGELVWSPADRP